MQQSLAFRAGPAGCSKPQRAALPQPQAFTAARPSRAPRARRLVARAQGVLATTLLQRLLPSLWLPTARQSSQREWRRASVPARHWQQPRQDCALPET